MKKYTRKVKNVSVKDLLDSFNEKLASPFVSEDIKRVYCIIIEDILHNTKNYKGYSNLYWINQGWKEWNDDNKPYDNNGNIPEKYFGKEYSRIYYG